MTKRDARPFPGSTAISLIAPLTMSVAGPGPSSLRLSSSGLRGGVPGQPEDRDQDDQGREDRQDRVVGQRGRPVGQVVGAELAHGALEQRSTMRAGSRSVGLRGPLSCGGLPFLGSKAKASCVRIELPLRVFQSCALRLSNRQALATRPAQLRSEPFESEIDRRAPVADARRGWPELEPAEREPATPQARSRREGRPPRPRATVGMARGRIELPTPRFSVVCSTN